MWSWADGFAVLTSSRFAQRFLARLRAPAGDEAPSIWMPRSQKEHRGIEGAQQELKRIASGPRHAAVHGRAGHPGQAPQPARPAARRPRPRHRERSRVRLHRQLRCHARSLRCATIEPRAHARPQAHGGRSRARRSASSAHGRAAALASRLHSQREMRAVLVLGVVLVGGCYNPALRNCTVQCSGPGDCGNGQVCGSDGWCAAADVAGRCDPLAAAADAQSAPIDADSACLTACTNGTCQRGVCVIDCSVSGSCLTDVLCPAGVPCRVVCGDHACQHRVDCRMASLCVIECSGIGSCADEVRCGTQHCWISCSGSGSCKHIRCGDACACDATCSGANACIEASECPQGGACRLGEGCTSSGSCNTCG